MFDLFKKSAVTLAAIVGLSTAAQAATVTDTTLYSELTSTLTYSFDLGAVDEAAASSLDVTYGGWQGLIPPFPPSVAGDVFVNSVFVGVWQATSGILSTPVTSTYDTTGFLRDGLNSFSFTPTFFAENYQSFAFNSFTLDFERPEVTVSTVPLPASALLLLAGLAGLGTMGARRKTV